MDVREYLDLVALGTVGDVMPMNYINRILVHKGTKVLESVARGVIEKPGVKALMKVAQLNGRVSAKDIAYSLAPRINAPGRIGDPMISLKLLIESDPVRAEVLARKVEMLNARRKAITESVYRSAYSMAVRREKESFLSLWDSGWHVGVLGIVAGRIAEALGKPVAVFSRGETKSVGSVRSVEGIDVYEGLRKISHLFIKWGGHPQAAGITLDSSLLEEFRRSAEEVFRNVKREPPPLYIDMEMSPQSFTRERFTDIDSLEPYGERNPFPTFLSERLEIRKVEYRQGRLILDTGGVNMVCWDKRLFPHIERGKKVRVVYSVMDREFHLIDLEDRYGP
ncbi:MAG: DHHA1 domain-containing protein [Aquificota bacterium]|nr:DHHA1 domain-containing protein [Aquificota bacterium]